MPEQLFEKFSWLKPDLLYAGPKGNKVQFKGVALLPTISGNGRRYVEEELHRSARTLVGKPLTLNHNPQKVLGDVSWAEFEDGKIEYVAETNKQEYIDKLQDRKKLTQKEYVMKWGKDPIYGVSVEAMYRYHTKDSQAVEPHGIIFTALSIVEDPERPGVAQSTVELMETTQSIEAKLTEALVKDFVPKEFQSSVFTESQKEGKFMSNEGCDCPEGQHKNFLGKCVPDDSETPEKEEDQAFEMLNLKQNLEKAEFKRAKETKALQDSITKTTNTLTVKIGEVDNAQKTCCNKLGEAQQQLLEVEALAKGSLDKIVALEPKFADFTEAWQTKLTCEASNLVTLANEVKRDVDQLKVDLKSTQETVDPKIVEALKPLQEAIAKLPNIEETVKPINQSIQEALTKFTNIEQALQQIKETQTQQEKQLQETDNKQATFKIATATAISKLAETLTNAVKETQQRIEAVSDAQKKQLTEMQTNQADTIKNLAETIATLKTHVPPNFKTGTADPAKAGSGKLDFNPKS